MDVISQICHNFSNYMVFHNWNSEHLLFLTCLLMYSFFIKEKCEIWEFQWQKLFLLLLTTASAPVFGSCVCLWVCIVTQDVLSPHSFQTFLVGSTSSKLGPTSDIKTTWCSVLLIGSDYFPFHSAPCHYHWEMEETISF